MNRINLGTCRNIRLVLPIVLLLSLMPVDRGFAQATDSTAEVDTERGAWALQFMIDSNFQLTSFEGTSLSIKRDVGPQTAVRVGISVNGESSDFDELNNLEYLEVTSATESQISSFSFTLRSGVVQYFGGQTNVYPFVVVGPYFSYLTGSSEYVYTDQNTGTAFVETTTVTSESQTIQIGLEAGFGVEWFLTEQMSLSGEYKTLLYHEDYEDTGTFLETYSDGTPDRNSDSSSNRQGFVTESDAVKLGLSIYF